MRQNQDVKVKHFDVSNVIYHEFSHGAVSYMLKGKNINVMLEFKIDYRLKSGLNQMNFWANGGGWLGYSTVEMK